MLEEFERPEVLPKPSVWTPGGIAGVISGIAGALAVGLMIGSAVWGNGAQGGRAAEIQANHTAQIAQLQVTINGQQTLLYSINDTLARVAQRIRDMEPMKK